MKNLLVMWFDPDLSAVDEAVIVEAIAEFTRSMGEGDMLLTQEIGIGPIIARQIASFRKMKTVFFHRYGYIHMNGKKTARKWIDEVRDYPDPEMKAICNAISKCKEDGWVIKARFFAKSANSLPDPFVGWVKASVFSWDIRLIHERPEFLKPTKTKDFKESDIVWIDTETTGVHPDCAMIEIALVRTDATGRNVKEAIERKIHIPEGCRIEQVALEINGYTPEAWQNAMPMPLALNDVIDSKILSLNPTMGGHNTNFDMRFLYASFARCGMDAPPMRQHLICTKALGTKLTKKPNLKNLCDLLGISNVGAHTAMADVNRAREVFLRLNA